MRDQILSFISGLYVGIFIFVLAFTYTPEMVSVYGTKGNVLTVEYKDVVYKLVPLEGVE